MPISFSKNDVEAHNVRPYQSPSAGSTGHGRISRRRTAEATHDRSSGRFSVPPRTAVVFVVR
ncbi:MAG: hypothetical protein ABL934_14290 [Lysobacteraceae bacterium]